MQHILASLLTALYLGCLFAADTRAETSPASTLPLSEPIHVPQGRPVIVPKPAQLNWSEEKLRLASPVRIVVADGKGHYRLPVRLLVGDLQTRADLDCAVGSEVGRPFGGVVLGVRSWGSRIDELCRRLRLPQLPHEGYALHVDSRTALVAGADARGLLYGVQTLRQLLMRDEEGPFIWGVRIVDYPDLSFRGWATQRGYFQRGATAEFLDLLSLLKFNTWLPELDDTFSYSSHPELRSYQSLPKTTWRGFLRRARERQMETIPLLELFGHAQWIINQRPDLAEFPELAKEGKAWNYCPRNPDTLKLVFDIMDEVIDLFKPRILHIGHDEMSFEPLGKCARCRGATPAELVAEETLALHAHLRKRGVRMMMWNDQLDPGQLGGPHWQNVADALPRIPKDVIMAVWNYAPQPDFPDIRYMTAEAIRSSPRAGTACLTCITYHWPPSGRVLTRTCVPPGAGSPSSSARRRA